MDEVIKSESFRRAGGLFVVLCVSGVHDQSGETSGEKKPHASLLERDSLELYVV